MFEAQGLPIFVFLFFLKAMSETKKAKTDSDQVSDAVLDASRVEDPNSKVEGETATNDNMVMYGPQTKAEQEIEEDMRALDAAEAEEMEEARLRPSIRRPEGALSICDRMALFEREHDLPTGSAGVIVLDTGHHFIFPTSSSPLHFSNW